MIHKVTGTKVKQTCCWTEQHTHSRGGEEFLKHPRGERDERDELKSRQDGEVRRVQLWVEDALCTNGGKSSKPRETGQVSDVIDPSLVYSWKLEVMEQQEVVSAHDTFVPQLPVAPSCLN